MRTTWLFVSVGALACSGDPGPEGPPVDLVFVDPAGTEAVQASAVIDNRTLTGEGCEPTDWFLVEAGDNFRAWFPVDRHAASLARSGEAVVVTWGNSPDVLKGGLGQYVTNQPTLFEYSFEAAQHCVSGDCDPAPAFATLRLEGEDLSMLAPPGTEHAGEPGWATDPSNGEARCGSDFPGT